MTTATCSMYWRTENPNACHFTSTFDDVIAPYEEWITRYGDRIGLLGGIDVDLLCQNEAEDVFEIVLQRGMQYRSMANGYALGSGNSIPDYVPVDGYLAMVQAAQRIREIEE